MSSLQVGLIFTYSINVYAPNKIGILKYSVEEGACQLYFENLLGRFNGDFTAVIGLCLCV